MSILSLNDSPEPDDRLSPEYSISNDLKRRFENLQRSPTSEPSLAALLGIGTEGAT